MLLSRVCVMHFLLSLGSHEFSIFLSCDRYTGGRCWLTLCRSSHIMTRFQFLEAHIFRWVVAS
ncbi:hypothetical protein BDR03DRAFT_940569 [Suillus americanus]|nr:hypothetical protein BDR03DRAFT_940569 [Suillus americanus]